MQISEGVPLGTSIIDTYTRFGFTTVGVYNTSIIDTYTSKTKSGSSEGNLISC